MKKQKTSKEIMLQYIYDYGVAKSCILLDITPEELDAILNPPIEQIYIHKNNYKDLPLNSMVASVIANNYESLYQKYVTNKGYLTLSQNDEDIFHETLLSIIEDPEVIENKILRYIDDKIKMMKFRNTMDNKLHKKIFTDAINTEAEKDTEESNL